MNTDTMSGLTRPSGRRTTTISLAVVAGLVRAMDLCLLCCAGVFSTQLTTWFYGRSPEGPIVLASVFGAIAVVFGLSREQAYTQPNLLLVSAGVRVLIKPVILGLCGVIGCLFVMHNGSLPYRAWPFVWAGSAAVFVGLSRVPLAGQLSSWTGAGRLARKVAIVGFGEFSSEFIQRLRDEPNAYKIVGLYDDRMSRVPSSQLGVEVLGTVSDLLNRSREEKIDVIVVALPLSAVERIKTIMEQLSSAVADIVLTTDLAGLQYSRSQFASLGRNPVVLVRETPLKDWRALGKAALDYSVGTLALVMLSPVLLATAIAIRLESPGPILFRQPRMGFNNQPFLCYKFRSMHHRMTDLLADKQTTRDDPRITRVGRIIRTLSVDELPQLFNVLNGTMSLVGPRPHAPNTKAADRLFTDVVRQYALRHRVKPGITGWAQVNGWRGETSTVEQIEQRVACDLFYIENWSVSFDLKILVMTILREIGSRNAF